MRKRIAIMFAALAIVVLGALPAQAHDFAGFGDCEGWTLQLDGLFGATAIIIDGASYAPALEYFFADASASTSREFTVTWDKPQDDVTRVHTLQRRGDCQVPTTTTTLEVTTTTQPEVTTTTGTPPTTEPVVTTTTVVEPTTTITVAGESTTTQVPTSSPREELPYTGPVDAGLLLVAAMSLATVGGLLLAETRRDA